MWEFFLNKKRAKKNEVEQNSSGNIADENNNKVEIISNFDDKKSINYAIDKSILNRNNDENKSECLLFDENLEEYKPVHLQSDKVNNQYGEFGVYLTDINYTSNPAIGREKEIRDLCKQLIIPKSGVVLVGDAGVGKTSIVEGLAYQIQHGNVCKILKNKGILSINVADLISGTKYRGDFEHKVQLLCNKLIMSKDVIVFFDEMHTSLGAGVADGSCLDLANLLKTYISNDLIKVIGCTTREEYLRNFYKDSAYERRFRVINVCEPDLVNLKHIIYSVMQTLADRYKLKINLSDNEYNNLFDIIYRLSTKKMQYQSKKLCNPDSSIKILSECFAYFVIENLEEIKYNDFIDSIIDDSTLNLSDMYINNNLLSEKTDENTIKEIDRSKVFTMTSYRK